MPYLVATAGVGAGSVANRYRVPQNVRDRCNGAIDIIVEAYKSQEEESDDPIYAEFDTDAENFVEGLLTEEEGGMTDSTKIDQIVGHLNGREKAHLSKVPYSQNKPSIILSRHFDTVLMDRASQNDTPEPLKDILMLMTKSTSKFQQRLIKEGALRTTESFLGRKANISEKVRKQIEEEKKNKAASIFARPGEKHPLIG